MPTRLAGFQLLHSTSEQCKQTNNHQTRAASDPADLHNRVICGQPTFASEIDIKDGMIDVTREIDGGLETLSLKLPVIVTTDLRLNEPRYVKLPNIMKAKKKPMDTFTTDELGVDVTPTLTILKVEEPPQRSAGIKVADVAELVDKLHNEAKVI